MITSRPAASLGDLQAAGDLLGARLVQVYSDSANTAAEALYQSVDFQRGGAHLR